MFATSVYHDYRLKNHNTYGYVLILYGFKPKDGATGETSGADKAANGVPTLCGGKIAGPAASACLVMKAGAGAAATNGAA